MDVWEGELQWGKNIQTSTLNDCYLVIGVGIRRAQLQKTIHSCAGDGTWTADTQIWCPHVWPHLWSQTFQGDSHSRHDGIDSCPFRLLYTEQRTTQPHNWWNNTDTIPSHLSYIKPECCRQCSDISIMSVERMVHGLRTIPLCPHAASASVFFMVMLLSCFKQNLLSCEVK